MKLKVRVMIFLGFLLGAAVVLFSSWNFELSPSSFTPSSFVHSSFTPSSFTPSSFTPSSFTPSSFTPSSFTPRSGALWNIGGRDSGHKVHVLLVGSWRSGSSFMGQVFNQHPSVFYLMEPALHIWLRNRKKDKQSLQMPVSNLLHNLFKCNISALNPYCRVKNRLGSLPGFFRSRAFCSPPVCPLTPPNQFSNEGLCSKICKNSTTEKAQEACHTYSHVVIKVVRIFELESLYPLLQDPDLDLRIIHLVRDPRAVMQSRVEAVGAILRDNPTILDQRKVPAGEVLYQVMQEVCHSHVIINQQATMDPPPFLKGRYKLVRYEDVVRNPIEEITALYEFVGLEMTERLMDWIYTMTHGTSDRHGGFKTNSRDALTISQAWRTVLLQDNVNRLQEVCEEAMRLLGYKEVHSEEEQKRLDIDLLLPLEPHKFNRSPAKNPGNI